MDKSPPGATSDKCDRCGMPLSLKAATVPNMILEDLPTWICDECLSWRLGLPSPSIVPPKTETPR